MKGRPVQNPPEPPPTRLTTHQLFHRGLACVLVALVCGLADNGRHSGLFLLTVMFGVAGMWLLLEADKRDTRK